MITKILIKPLLRIILPMQLVLGSAAVQNPIHASLPGVEEKPAVKTVLFLGNSLTAGYGLTPQQAFPALIQAKIDSLRWPFKVVNAGLSGETSSGGLRRIDWLLNGKIDVLVLELGGNDMLRGLPTDLTKANLRTILRKTQKKYPDVKLVITGMQAPANLGQEYTQQFKSLYIELAEEIDAALIPFLLEGVGGIPELNLPDGIHPTAEGHKIVAENVWEILQPVLMMYLPQEK